MLASVQGLSGIVHSAPWSIGKQSNFSPAVLTIIQVQQNIGIAGQATQAGPWITTKQNNTMTTNIQNGPTSLLGKGQFTFPQKACWTFLNVGCHGSNQWRSLYWHCRTATVFARMLRLATTTGQLTNSGSQSQHPSNHPSTAVRLCQCRLLHWLLP